MTEERFTTAPWTYYKCEDGSIDIYADNAPYDDLLIATVGIKVYSNSVKGTEAEANANLMYMSPEMYAKLAQILADLEDKYEKMSNEVEHYEIAGVQIGREVRNALKEHEQEINEISQLLKKARGDK